MELEIAQQFLDAWLDKASGLVGGTAVAAEMTGGTVVVMYATYPSCWAYVHCGHRYGCLVFQDSKGSPPVGGNVFGTIEEASVYYLGLLAKFSE